MNHKAPNSNLTSSDNNFSFKIPQHIYKLLTKLVVLQDKSSCETTLKQFANLLKYDEVLKNIFYYFGWDDQLKTFTKSIKYEPLVTKIEKEYEINLNDNTHTDEKSNEDGKTLLNRSRIWRSLLCKETSRFKPD
jgi:hypothetical protein